MEKTLGSIVAEIHRLHQQLREVQEQMERGPRQLKLRQQATLQKQAELEAQKQKYKALRVAVDQRSLQLKSNETKIGDLRSKLNQASSNREFDIIRAQMEADTVANSVLEDEILDSLWGVDYVSESNVVDRHIRNLRAKLQNDWRKPRFIATVPGRGYRFLPVFSDAALASS